MRDLQERIAARRAELERQHEQAQARAKVAAEARAAEEAAANEAAWLERERVKLARAERFAEPGLPHDPAEDARDKERMLAGAARKRWTAAEWTVVAVPALLGLWLLDDHPFWALLLLGLALALYAGGTATHREAVRKAHPDLFGEPTD